MKWFSKKILFPVSYLNRSSPIVSSLLFWHSSWKGYSFKLRILLHRKDRNNQIGGTSVPQLHLSAIHPHLSSCPCCEPADQILQWCAGIPPHLEGVSVTQHAEVFRLNKHFLLKYTKILKFMLQILEISFPTENYIPLLCLLFLRVQCFTKAFALKICPFKNEYCDYLTTIHCLVLIYQINRMLWNLWWNVNSLGLKKKIWFHLKSPFFYRKITKYLDF